MTEKKRGRPPKPKEAKEPKRMGRPTVWDERLGHTIERGTCAPEGFWECWKNHEFRKTISNLCIDFLARK